MDQSRPVTRRLFPKVRMAIMTFNFTIISIISTDVTA